MCIEDLSGDLVVLYSGLLERYLREERSIHSIETTLQLGLEVSFLGELSVLRMALLLMLWMPIWVVIKHLRSVTVEKRYLERNRWRYETYICLEEAIREIRRDLPISQQLGVAGVTIPKPDARRIHGARPKGGKKWDDKVAITELLERLDRFAVGVQVGILDIDVWYHLAGHRIVILYGVLRNFVEVSQEDRPDRYYALGVIDRTFRSMAAAEEVSKSDLPPLGIQRGQEA